MNQQEMIPTTLAEKEKQPFTPASMTYFREGFSLSIDEAYIRKIVSDELKRFIDQTRTKHVDNSHAEEIIISFINDKKRAGISEVDVLDIFEATRLPFGQIREIMERLKGRGIADAD